MLTLSTDLRDRLIDHAREGAPSEVCGVLGGELGETSHVRTVRPTSNAADEPRTRYAIDPAEQLSVMTRIEDDGGDVVGFYHSHPVGPSSPSDTDAATATWPGRSYVIVSLGGESPVVRSWRWTGERFEREQVTTR